MPSECAAAANFTVGGLGGGFALVRTDHVQSGCSTWLCFASLFHIGDTLGDVVVDAGKEIPELGGIECFPCLCHASNASGNIESASFGNVLLSECCA